MNTLFAATCADGYNAINIVSTDIDFGGGCANNSYTRYDTPDFDLYYIIPDAVTSRYTQGECDSDEYTVPTTLTMGQIGGKCPASYEQLYAAIERGISVISDDVPDFDQGECPTGYYDATVVTGLNLSPLNEGLCPSGYTRSGGACYKYTYNETASLCASHGGSFSQTSNTTKNGTGKCTYTAGAYSSASSGWVEGGWHQGETHWNWTSVGATTNYKYQAKGCPSGYPTSISATECRSNTGSNPTVCTGDTINGNCYKKL